MIPTATDQIGIDADGRQFVPVPADQLRHQSEMQETGRVFRENAARDAQDFNRFCEVVAEHFGITPAQVKLTWGTAHTAWQELRFEAERRKAEAARGAMPPVGPAKARR